MALKIILGRGLSSHQTPHLSTEPVHRVFAFGLAALISYIQLPAFKVFQSSYSPDTNRFSHFRMVSISPSPVIPLTSLSCPSHAFNRFAWSTPGSGIAGYVLANQRSLFNSLISDSGNFTASGYMHVRAAVDSGATVNEPSHSLGNYNNLFWK